CLITCTYVCVSIWDLALALALALVFLPPLVQLVLYFLLKIYFCLLWLPVFIIQKDHELVSLPLGSVVSRPHIRIILLRSSNTGSNQVWFSFKNNDDNNNSNDY
ncbi:hypothetical protein J3Q64DRAFT_1845960, partial [Phycomyces blakesleeanus]